MSIPYALVSILDTISLANQQDFQLLAIPGTYNQVFVDGVLQRSNLYTINGSTLSFNTPLAAGKWVTVNSSHGGSLVAPDEFEERLALKADVEDVDNSLAQKLSKAGDIATGQIRIPTDPTHPLGVVPKQMVDELSQRIEDRHDEQLGVIGGKADLSYVDTQLDQKLDRDLLGVEVAVLENGILSEWQLPATTVEGVQVHDEIASEAEQLTLNTKEGDIVIRTDGTRWIRTSRTGLGIGNYSSITGEPTASTVAFVPAGSIEAQNTQDAIEQLDLITIKEGDERLEDARIPLPHASGHVSGGDDPITPGMIGALPINTPRVTNQLEIGTATKRIKPAGTTIEGNTSITVESTEAHAFLSSRLNSHVASNCFWDGFNWFRYDNTRPACFIAPLSNDASGQPKFKLFYAGPGSGAISFTIADIWHADNDGPASGMNADTVDGLHAASFASNTHPHSATDVGALPIAGGRITGNTGVEFVTATKRIRPVGNTSIGNQSLTIDTSEGHLFATAKLNSHLCANAYYDGVNWMRYDVAQPARVFDVVYNGEPIMLYAPAGPNPITWTQYNIYHQGNDGAGSGVDADMLDGIQGSEYVTSEELSQINLQSIVYLPIFEAEVLEQKDGEGRFPLLDSGTITNIIAMVDTPSQGTAISLRVNKNGTQVATPSIPATQNHVVVNALEIDVVPTDYITVDILDPGSTPGSNLTVNARLLV